MMHISIGQTALLIGVSISTLRRWEREKRFLPKFRTKGGHRRYCLTAIREEFFGERPSLPKEKLTITYSRVSSHDQKEDLIRQEEVLRSYALEHGWSPFSIKDLGSGLNYEKRGLTKLLGLVCQGMVARILLTDKDRLLRFGSPLVFRICQQFGTEVVILSDIKQKTFEEELVCDVLEVMTVFCSKVYGKRSHRNRQKQRAA